MNPEELAAALPDMTDEEVKAQGWDATVEWQTATPNAKAKLDLVQAELTRRAEQVVS